jgi:hypothetical protein
MATSPLSENLRRYFLYLDEPRASGEVNTFAAPAYLAAFFGLTKQEAIETVRLWNETFDTSKSLDERVAEASRP